MHLIDVDFASEEVTLIIKFEELLELSSRIPSITLKTGAFELVEFGNYLLARKINKEEKE